MSIGVRESGNRTSDYFVLEILKTCPKNTENRSNKVENIMLFSNWED